MCRLDWTFTSDFSHRQAECQCKPGDKPCKKRCGYCLKFKNSVRSKDYGH